MKPKKLNKPSPLVNVGNVEKVSGSVNIASGDIKTQQKISIHYDGNAEIVAAALKSALAQVKTRPKTNRARKTVIQKEVKAIESVLGKKKADKGFLAKRFQNLAKMAPDIVEVIITGLGNPAAGLALTMKKIAEKAKAGAEKETASP